MVLKCNFKTSFYHSGNPKKKSMNYVYSVFLIVSRELTNISKREFLTSFSHSKPCMRLSSRTAPK